MDILAATLQATEGCIAGKKNGKINANATWRWSALKQYDQILWETKYLHIAQDNDMSKKNNCNNDSNRRDFHG